MAVYKNAAFLEPSKDGAFDQDHNPGVAAPFAGIYRCMGCGREIGIAEEHTLPSQNHHAHTSAQGKIRWRLALWADHNPK